MNYVKKLVGDRMYLSPKGVSDEEIEKFTKWMNDFQITDYTGRTSEIMSIIGEKQYLENSAKDNKNKKFNIVELNTNKLIGTVGLHEFDWISRMLY